MPKIELTPFLEGQSLLVLGLGLAAVLTSLAVVHSNARMRRHLSQDELRRQQRRQQRLQQDRAAQIVRPAEPAPQAEQPAIARAG